MTTGIKDAVIKNPSWWRKRTSLEKGLTLSTGISLLIGVSLIVALVSVLHTNSTENNEHSKPKALHLATLSKSFFGQSATSPLYNIYDSNKSDKKPSICVKPGCIHSASRILKYMDDSVDPCDDFYQFTCGNYVRTTNIPDDKSSVTSFSQISDELQEQLRTILEEPIKNGTHESKAVRLVKTLYRSCMNKTRIEEAGLTFVKDILKSLGGWPVIEGDSWNEENFSWIQTVYKLRRIGLGTGYFVDVQIGADFKNSTKRTLDIDQPGLGLRREFLINGLEEKLVRAYYDYMVDIAAIFGANKENAKKELMQSLQFEIELANITLPSEKRRNASALYNPMSIGALQAQYKALPWLEYFNTILKPEAQVQNETVVTVSTLQYLKDFEELIGRTPKRIQANFIFWRVTGSVLSYLNEQIRQRQLEYATVVSGRTEREARWKECTDLATGSLSLAAASLYVKRHFKEEARQNAIEMVADIRVEFQKILKNVDWMDEKTKKNALEKASSMATHIAYPDELLDDNKLDEFYSDLEIDDGNYLKSILNLTLFSRRYSHRRLYLRVNKTDWVTHGSIAVVNAYYSSLENSIQFPAGILQGVFFDADRPKYMNYGAIGFVIGHEITHGFDDQGRQFNKDGNLIDWWALETKSAYLEKAQCVIDQYGNYTVPDLNINLNGVNTQGENIADNGGVKEAYLAYQAWVERNGQEPILPGLEYTPNQLFWVSAANIWCAKYRPEVMKIRVKTGYHSPGNFRVIGSMSNQEHFARDFDCPVGSNMNPVKKCNVW